MSIVFQTRPPDSPYIKAITQGYTPQKGMVIRPAETNWHLVFSQLRGKTQVLVVGPCSEAAPIGFEEGEENLWIQLSLGVFMPLSIQPTRPVISIRPTSPIPSSGL